MLKMSLQIIKYLCNSRSCLYRSSVRGIYHYYSIHHKLKEDTKWEYSDTEILDIVRHMQTLALLRPPQHKGVVEGEADQVDYLRSAMRIASQLREVTTDGVEPLHNPSQNIVLRLQQDTPTQLSSEEREVLLKNSKSLRDGWYVTPPIPAYKTSN